MAMNKVPTLVVGIGGIGCQIAAGVGELLGREDREYVGIVGIDTNVNDISTLQGNSGIRMITTSDSNTVRDHLKAHREYTRWFPVSKFIVDKTTTDGAGQIRAVSRLTAIAAETNGRFTPIEEEIKRVRKNKGENKRNTLAVMIVGSITGGTGAGLFLQIPYYIRSYVKRTTGLDGLVIRGMFVSADITGPVQPSRINEDAVHANAYACIKELNAFYLTQTDPRQQKLLDLEWFEKQDEEERRITARRLKDNYDPDDDLYEDDEDALILADDGVSAEDRKILSDDQANIPYNYLYLIENDDQGLVSIESVVNQISRIVFTYLFTPVSNNALSIEDNFALQDTGRNGMNRYASAGLCRLIYPKELVETYVTLCSARDLVKEQWLKIDQDCEEERKVRINDMKTDPRAEIPKVEDSYQKFFEQEVKHGALTRLAKQAYSDEDMKVSNANDFLDTVDGIIKETLSQEELVNAKNACTLDMSKMKKAGSAKKQITELYEAFEEYEKLAKVMVETAPAGIANAIFPTSFESLINSKDKPGSIYSLLFNAHPIVARNYCYQLITELNTRIEALEDKVKGVNLDAYEAADFDDTEDDVQSPQQAIDKIVRSKGFLGIKGIARKLGADVDADQLEKMTQDVNQKLVNYQTRQIANYLETVKLKVYTYLRKRLLLLTKNYERFFSISSMLFSLLLIISERPSKKRS